MLNLAIRMPRILLYFVLLLQNWGYSQKEFNLVKSSENIIVLDGFISSEEKKSSLVFPIDFEQEPGDNIPTKLESEVYVTYTDTFIYFGIKAYGDPQNIRG
ncbi:MAG: hypothetical protein HOA78_01250, partial [Cryomorphaceae bacterium]|nr:hypothetical protein [Cryomorphaceae bacterium]